MRATPSARDGWDAAAAWMAATWTFGRHGARLETTERARRLSVSDFYGIRPGTIPGFADVGGGKFMSVQGLPEGTVRNMSLFMHKLRGMHEDDPLAFEVCVRHIASVIEDQRRSEGKTDPRDGSAP